MFQQFMAVGHIFWTQIILLRPNWVFPIEPKVRPKTDEIQVFKVGYGLVGPELNPIGLVGPIGHTSF